jgi:predicted nucleotide-binding protein
MAVNSALFEKLKSKLGVGRAAVYRQIAQANDLMLDTDLAALYFATKNGIDIKRYSTQEERTQLRAARAGQSQVHVAVPAASVPVSTARSSRRASVKPTVRKPKDGTVFVVHGRNEVLRKSMFDLLRSLGLDPIEWEKAVAKVRGGNPYLGDVLRANMADAQAIVVLFTPDEEARLKAELCNRGEKRTEGALLSQARPNVIFEAGWAVGAFPKKTVLVQVGKSRSFSDIGGKLMVHLSDDPAKRRVFANRLKAAGCKPDITGTDWLTTGKFKA